MGLLSVSVKRRSRRKGARSTCHQAVWGRNVANCQINFDDFALQVEISGGQMTTTTPIKRNRMGLNRLSLYV